MYGLLGHSSSKWDILIPVLIAFGIVGAVVGTLFLFGPELPKVYTAEPKFYVGQIVRINIAKDIPAMIVGSNCRVSSPASTCKYRIRTAVPQDRTDVSLFGEDGPIKHQPLATLWMNEFELSQK